MKKKIRKKPTKKRLWIGSGLVLPLGIGFYLLSDHLFGSDLAHDSPMTVTGIMLFLLYVFYLKFGYGIRGSKPLGEISFGKRLLGLILVVGVASAFAGAISSIIFGTRGALQGALRGGFVGVFTAGLMCALFELMLRLFPKQASRFLLGKYEWVDANDLDRRD